MRFLVDEQLPPALARWLTAQGHDARHVVDVGLQGAGDRDVWSHAIAKDMVLVTKDSDFVERANQGAGTPVIWITMGNCRRQELLDRIGRALPQVITALKAGERVIEIR